MRARGCQTNPRTYATDCAGRGVLASILDRATILRFTITTFGMVLLFYAMLTLRRWNY